MKRIIMKNRGIFFSLMLLLVFALLLPLLFQGLSHTITVSIDEKPPYKGILCVYYKKAGMNDWVELGCSENTLTNIGKNYTERQLIEPQAASTANQLKYIALSNVSTACTSTSTNIQEITTGGLERALCTVTHLDYGKWSCEQTFTANAHTPNVQIAGLFWNGTAGNDGSLFACGSFTPVTLEQNDNILIRWNITISEGS
jgi:hypothetical protein